MERCPGPLRDDSAGQWPVCRARGATLFRGDRPRPAERHGGGRPHRRNPIVVPSAQWPAGFDLDRDWSPKPVMASARGGFAAALALCLLAVAGGVASASFYLV